MKDRIRDCRKLETKWNKESATMRRVYVGRNVKTARADRMGNDTILKSCLFLGSKLFIRNELPTVSTGNSLSGSYSSVKKGAHGLCSDGMVEKENGLERNDYVCGKFIFI